MSTTTTTPAEAAYRALINHHFNERPLRFCAAWYQDDWKRAAQAAINAHLNQVAEGLPSVEEMLEATRQDAPLRSVRALFTERFAKLQAERDEWEEKALVLQSQVDNADVTLAQVKLCAETKIAQSRPLLDLLESLGWNGVENSKIAHIFLRGYIDGMMARWANDITHRDNDIAELNQRLIERTEGFMRRLAEKTRRERYVPQDEHKEMKRAAVEALEEAYAVFYDPECLSPGTLGLAACDKIKETIAKLKGDQP